jgi:hypothetical protein
VAATVSLSSADTATAAASIPQNEARVSAYTEGDENTLEWHNKKPHGDTRAKQKLKISPFVPGRGFAAAPSLSSVASAALKRQVSGKCSAMWGGISGKRKLASAVFMG